jgi:DNA-binding Xre family transcriptional regulator
MLSCELFKEELAKRNLTKKQAMKELSICENTFYDFLNGKNVRMSVIDKICTKWRLQPKDIITYVKEEDCPEEQSSEN